MTLTTGALGKFADTNLARTAVLSGGTWSTDLPLANMQTEDAFVAFPARQLQIDDPAASQFTITLATPRTVNLVALLFHTLSLSARYRLTVRGPGGTWEAPSLQTAWTDVYGRLWDSEVLDWEAPNWWTGQLTEDEIDLYRRHLWITPAQVLAAELRIELEDPTNPAGFFDIGGLFVASTWSPAFNFSRGRSVGLTARDQIDEGPSGRRFGEPRTPVRQVSVEWSNLSTPEAYRWLDASARARTTGVVIFMPDSDHEPTRVREAFPANFERPPAARFTYEHAHQVAAVFKEILA